MRDQVYVDPDQQRHRWVAHLDLLGASALVESESWDRVFRVYSRANETFRGEAFDEHLIERITFSDSFILYTIDATALSYRALDSFCRHFIVELIRASLPVRGAMACGELYADPAASLYFGKALLDAYRLGESQNWVGFVLSETARDQLAVVGLPAHERLNYALWNVPMKIKGEPTFTESNLPSLILGLSPSRSNVEPVMATMRVLKAKAPSDSVRRMYENTIEFLEKNIREPAC
jgi:hypothetical protein